MPNGPNDTLDLSDYPPASRLSLEAACNEYAEQVYRLKAVVRLTTAALAFYADPIAYRFRRSNPKITPAVTVDGGEKARHTLDDVLPFLDKGAQDELRRCKAVAGDNDR
jgi:hypothetical protein